MRELLVSLSPIHFLLSHARRVGRDEERRRESRAGYVEGRRAGQGDKLANRPMQLTLLTRRESVYWASYRNGYIFGYDNPHIKI
jgi:hypothetical protein